MNTKNDDVMAKAISLINNEMEKNNISEIPDYINGILKINPEYIINLVTNNINIFNKEETKAYFNNKSKEMEEEVKARVEALRFIAINSKSKKYRELLSIIDQMTRVISHEENIPYQKLKIYDICGYTFITDGSRIFKLVLPKPLAKYFEKTNTWDSLVENNQDYISRVTYKEVTSNRIKIYLSKDDADDFEAAGCLLYRTLNGSRTGFNRYILLTKEDIFEEAKDISEL